MAKSPDKPRDPGQAFEEGSRETDARQGGAGALAPIAPRAGEAAQSRHREGHRRRRLADRPVAAAGSSRRPTIRSTAAPISPPPTRRATRRRGVQRSAAERLCGEGAARASSIRTSRGRWGSRMRTRVRRPLPDPPPQGGRRASPCAGEGRTRRRHRRFFRSAVRAKRSTTSPPGDRTHREPGMSLDRLLREGRPEFTERPWVPHRPPRPEKSEGGFRLEIKSDFDPKGDQPAGDRGAGRGRQRNDRTQVLLGVTGSGKTFTMAKVIEATQRPALILAPNKTLAAQLYGEFRCFFPDNAVEYFVSLLRLLPAGSLRPAHRHLYREGILDQRADRPHAPLGDARAARTRRRDHRRLGVVHLRHRLGRDLFGDDLRAQAGRAHQPAPADRRPRRRCNTSAPPATSTRGTFRVRGDTIDIFPAHYEDRAWRVNLFGDEVGVDRRVRSAHRAARPTS